MPAQTKDKDRVVRIIALICFFAALILYFILNRTEITSIGNILSNENRLSATNAEPVRFDASTLSSFYVYEKGMFQISKDSVRYMTLDGKPQWEEMLNISLPLYQAEGNIVAVSEYRGRSFHVYDDKGLLYEKQFDHPIMNFSINKNGYSCVFYQTDDYYSMQLFNRTGELVTDGPFANKNIFPFASDISENNRYLAVSLVDINNITIDSQIVFASLDPESHYDYIDGIVAATVIKQNSIIGVLHFMNDSDLIYASELEVACAEILDDKYTAKWSVELGNRLSQLSFGSDSIAFALGEPVINKQSDDLGTVYQYSLSGEVLSSKKTGKEVTYLYSDKNATIIGNGRVFQAAGKNGGTLWTLNATKDVKQVLFMDESNRVLMVSNTMAEEMRVQKGQNLPDQTEAPLEASAEAAETPDEVEASPPPAESENQ